MVRINPAALLDMPLQYTVPEYVAMRNIQLIATEAGRGNRENAYN